MELLELTLNTPAENLALDEALLEAAEGAGQPSEALRIWESPAPTVVVGRASEVDVEVNVTACRELGVPILRRHSGGAAIVAGPGCLMYAIVLSYQRRPHLRMIDQAHAFVLERIVSELQGIHPDAQRSGISDLTIGGRQKFSGNSLRCCRTHMLYHGTLLYAFPLELIAKCLRQPPRQPEYRADRSHAEFVSNLPAHPDELRTCITRAWKADRELQFDAKLKALTKRLALEKYSRDAWNLRR